MTALTGADPGLLPPDAGLVAAVSGGLDSVVLLHWLRFGLRRRDVHVAHLDHALRPDSAADAAWVRGLCRAWDLPVTMGRLSVPPASEEAARDARYAFLEDVRGQLGAAVVVTAHHADDQAETVLFRTFRGTGILGLRGMSPRHGRVVRPLLAVWREELQGYAAAARLRWREDASNADLGLARNALRHRILPDAERWVAPGARRSLVRLSGNARAAGEELAAADALLVEPLLVESSVNPLRVEIREAGLAALPPPLRRRALRLAAHRAGVRLSQDATRRAMAAVDGLQRGRGVDLADGVRLERGSRSWILHRPPAAGAGGDPDLLRISRDSVGPEGCGGLLSLPGRRYRVRWREAGPGLPGGEDPLRSFARRLPPDAFPLILRGWRAGDRIRRPYGRKAVAKLLAEAGVAALDRPGVPVLSDALDRILWVPGMGASPPVEAARDPLRGDPESSVSFHITCEVIPS